jgi:uncharacterized protein YcbX
MSQEVGRIKAIYRFPVKSMAGQALSSATLGWHGLDGDRRFAFLRFGVPGGFPWLSATRFPRLLRYHPQGEDGPSRLPTRVLTPEGRELDLRGAELREEISEIHGAPVELTQLDQGIFDEAKVSVIGQVTIDEIARESGIPLEVERFRPNLLLETLEGKPFGEDDWVGKVLRLGEGSRAPAVHVYMRDVRCATITHDPVTTVSTPNVLRAVVRLNDNNAGVYASVVGTGVVSVGERVYVQDL